MTSYKDIAGYLVAPDRYVVEYPNWMMKHEPRPVSFSISRNEHSPATLDVIVRDATKAVLYQYHEFDHTAACQLNISLKPAYQVIGNSGGLVSIVSTKL